MDTIIIPNIIKKIEAFKCLKKYLLQIEEK